MAPLRGLRMRRSSVKLKSISRIAALASKADGGRPELQQAKAYLAQR
jgi:hypothetical protein